MIGRIIVLLLALGLLGLLLYMQQPETNSTESTASNLNSEGPGFVAIDAQIIETGDNGQPLYRLQAKRISQPVPQGLIYLTGPVLNYTPPGANPWVLTAQQGELPQDAHTAELHGAVTANGKPQGWSQVMQFSTETLHVDMQQQLASSSDVVYVRSGGSLLHGRGMRANLKSGEVELFRDVGGELQRGSRGLSH